MSWTPRNDEAYAKWVSNRKPEQVLKDLQEMGLMDENGKWIHADVREAAFSHTPDEPYQRYRR